MEDSLPMVHLSCGGSSPGAKKGFRTTSISTRNWNFKINVGRSAPESQHWRIQMSCSEAHPFSYCLLFRAFIHTSVKHAGNNSVSVRHSHGTQQTLYSYLSSCHCSSTTVTLDSPYNRRFLLDLKKRLIYQNQIQLQNIITSSWKWSCPIFQTVAGFLCPKNIF